jgi:predicted ester cyclase
MRIDSIRKSNIESFRKVTDIMNFGKMDDTGKYIADNYTEHQMMPGQKPGLAGMKEMMAGMHMAYPDMKFTINQITADTNMIWGLSTMTGTNTGSMMGMPPTGKAINVQAVDIVRLENGKAVEHWGFMEEKKMMQQMGMMPPDAAPPAAGGATAPDMKKGK